MDYSSYPATTRIMCNKLSRVGPSGSVRAVSEIRMRIESVRLSTFLNWIPGPNGSPTPQTLSSAGFIYRGVADHIQCFKCSLVLSQWLPVHNPDIEHHRYSPGCEFLMSRSQYFYNDLRSISTPTTPSEDCWRQSGPENNNVVVETTPNITKTSPTEASLCKICYNQHMEILFRPCGHLLTCRSCANQLINCPICRTPISETVRAFVSFE